jgi:hypothetical protein
MLTRACIYHRKRSFSWEKGAWISYLQDHQHNKYLRSSIFGYKALTVKNNDWSGFASKDFNIQFWTEVNEIFGC